MGDDLTNEIVSRGDQPAVRLRVNHGYGASVGGSVAAERKRRTSANREQPVPPADWGGEWGEWEPDPFYRNHLFRHQIGTRRYLMARFRTAAGAEQAMRRWNRENARPRTGCVGCGGPVAFEAGFDTCDACVGAV